MNDEKIQIHTPEQFEAAMGSVQTAMMILGSFDWQHLVDQANLFQGAGAVLDPETFIAMKKDPQWEQKLQLFKAAARFTGELDDIKEQLRP